MLIITVLFTQVEMKIFQIGMEISASYTINKSFLLYKFYLEILCFVIFDNAIKNTTNIFI